MLRAFFHRQTKGAPCDDVIVIGGGPGGAMAAIAAARNGAKTLQPFGYGRPHARRSRRWNTECQHRCLSSSWAPRWQEPEQAKSGLLSAESVLKNKNKPVVDMQHTGLFFAFIHPAQQTHYRLNNLIAFIINCKLNLIKWRFCRVVFHWNGLLL